jgi:hypothetical protein
MMEQEMDPAMQHAWKGQVEGRWGITSKLMSKGISARKKGEEWQMSEVGIFGTGGRNKLSTKQFVVSQ